MDWFWQDAAAVAVLAGECQIMEGVDDSGRTDNGRGLSSMLTIGDMSRRYGLTLRALRFYEDRGLVEPLRHGTIRFYDAEACRRIEIILRGKHLGYTLTSIAALLRRNGADSDPGLGADVCEVQAQIGRLERKRQELDVAIAELRDVHRRFVGLPPAGAESAA